MKYSSKFDIDLKIGKELEDKLEGILSGRVRAEVKRDFWAKRTGNVAIEFESRGKPSGIAVTDSLYWIIGIEGGVVIIAETEKVKKIARKYYRAGAIKSMGDKNTSRAVLIPMNEYIRLLI